MTFLRLSRKKMLWRMGPIGKGIRFFKQPYTIVKRTQARVAYSAIQRVNAGGQYILKLKPTSSQLESIWILGIS